MVSTAIRLLATIVVMAQDHTWSMFQKNFQAGVAIGMALVAGNYFPGHAQLLLSVVISSTIFFEIIGPIFTRMAIRKAEKG